MWDRIREHQDNLRLRKESSCLLRHQKDHHGDKPTSFEVKALRTYKTATERQVAEALNIERGDHDIIMNSKSEFGRNAIAVLSTRFGDRMWDRGGDNITPRDTDNKKRLADITLSAPENQTDFSSQYSQRRKRLKIEKDKEKASALLATASGNSDVQRQQDVATDSPSLSCSGPTTI